jgi:hypothetical protein
VGPQDALNGNARGNRSAGEGGAPNFLETDVVHLTVNAKGVVTASVEKSMIRCV